MPKMRDVIPCPEALSISTRSLLEDTNAISIPEKKAENSRTMMQLMIIIVMGEGLWVRGETTSNVLVC